MISEARQADLNLLLDRTDRLPIPCRADPPLWLSDDPDDQAAAAAACEPCPALHALPRVRPALVRARRCLGRPYEEATWGRYP